MAKSRAGQPPPGRSTAAGTLTYVVAKTSLSPEIMEHSTNGKSPAGDIGPVSMHTAAGEPSAVPAWIEHRPWLPLVLPFVVYMVCGMFEPTATKPFEFAGLVIDYASYPQVYTVKILLTMAAIAAVGPGYRQFPFRVTLLAPVVGAVGVVLWIGICKLELEPLLLDPLGLDWMGQRSAFDPLGELADQPLWAYGFLAIRFWGLVVVVPLVEEFFLRTFVMRFVIDAEWSKIPFGTLTPTAIVVGTLAGMLTHPGELFAAAVWFTLVTWLMFATRNIWDCVVAHAVTNLLLGVWVVTTGDWKLW
jgi:CAAX protease family protein